MVFSFFVLQTNTLNMDKATQYIPYKVKAMSLADWGRIEFKIAEALMPRLMALDAKIGVELETLRADQADYASVTVGSPFNPELDRN